VPVQFRTENWQGPTLTCPSTPAIPAVRLGVAVQFRTGTGRGAPPRRLGPHRHPRPLRSGMGPVEFWTGTGRCPAGPRRTLATGGQGWVGARFQFASTGTRTGTRSYWSPASRAPPACSLAPLWDRRPPRTSRPSWRGSLIRRGASLRFSDHKGQATRR
jgi:hypothetical protein